MSQQIAVRIADGELRQLDAAVDRGSYPTRAAAVRAALELLLREEREREIAERYRRGYAERPQEGWVGDAGREAMAEVLDEEAARDHVDPSR